MTSMYRFNKETSVIRAITEGLGHIINSVATTSQPLDVVNPCIIFPPFKKRKIKKKKLPIMEFEVLNRRSTNFTLLQCT